MPTAPVPPAPGVAVSGFVFLDENANGTVDAVERVRLPNVTVSIGGRSAATTAGGVFTIENVPTGTQTATIRADGLPAYFAPGAAAGTVVPAPAPMALPAVQPIGPDATPNLYAAFGDSITCGDGSSGGGYRDLLAADLRAFWGAAEVANDCADHTRSNVGESRIATVLRSRRPAYVLILYGTNDYNDPDCRRELPCYAVAALRSIVEQTQLAGALPVLGTIPPVNPDWLDHFPEERNDWVRRLNDMVRAMAEEKQVPLADVHTAFLRHGSLATLFADDKHPNDAGYQLISRAFFDAITRPRGAAAAGPGWPVASLGRLESNAGPGVLFREVARAGHGEVSPF